MQQAPIDESGDPIGSRLPERFGRYRIRQVLGQGAMGRVYLAEDVPLGRRVALKIPHLGEGDSTELLERFYREARSAGGLNHPNICPVYDVGEIDGIHYIAMAYIEGRPLSALLGSEKPLADRQVMILVRKLSHALQEAHNHHIVHRDLKPSNIMLDVADEPIITDFGLARRIYREEDTRLTRSGMILGSPAYMSPEQAMGDQATIGPASDQYSLGVILYQMLTGHVPFRGSFAAMTKQILNDPPTPPGQLRSDLAPELEALCLKMLAKSPTDRFPSMSAVADELSTLLAGSSQPMSLPNAASDGTGLQATVTMTPPVSNNTKRSRRLLVSLGTLAVVVLAVGIWALMSWQRTPQRSSVAQAPRPELRAKAKPSTKLTATNVSRPRRRPPTTRTVAERSTPPPPPSDQSATVERGHARAFGKQLRVFDTRPDHYGGFTCVAFSPEGAQIASGTVLGAVVVWSIPTGRVVAVLKGHDSYVRCVEFSSDGRWLASGGFDHAIEIWDTSTRREAHRLLDHTSPVLSLAFRPDGTQLFSASSDRVLRFWNVATQHAVLTQAFNDQKTGRSPMVFPSR